MAKHDARLVTSLILIVKCSLIIPHLEFSMVAYDGLRIIEPEIWNNIINYRRLSAPHCSTTAIPNFAINSLEEVTNARFS
jgi:hypothetical protein